MPTQYNKRYQIIDTKTGQQVGKDYASRARARSRADRLDNEYGAYRYAVRVSPNFSISF